MWTPEVSPYSVRICCNIQNLPEGLVQVVVALLFELTASWSLQKSANFIYEIQEYTPNCFECAAMIKTFPKSLYRLLFPFLLSFWVAGSLSNIP